MLVTFGKELEDNRCVNKTMIDTQDIELTFRTDVDRYNPVLMLKNFNPDWNYLYIPDWGYYYITNKEYTQNGVWTISTHIDVLMSFKETLMECSCLVAQSTEVDNFYDGGDYLSKETFENDIYTSDVTLADTYNNILISVGMGVS